MHGNNVFELFRARALPSQKPSPWCPVLKKFRPISQNRLSASDNYIHQKNAEFHIFIIL